LFRANEEILLRGEENFYVRVCMCVCVCGMYVNVLEKFSCENISLIQVCVFILIIGSCIWKGAIHQNGVSFSDDCNTCSCSNGDVICTLVWCDAGKLLNIYFFFKNRIYMGSKGAVEGIRPWRIIANRISSESQHTAPYSLPLTAPGWRNKAIKTCLSQPPRGEPGSE
jgi:hypothetical protein